MRTTTKLVTFAAGCLLSSGALAFECPGHFAEAAAAIAAAGEAIDGASSEQRKREAHMLLDDAKMLLHGAKHNHEKPQGTMDHARAIAKADAAIGYARAAEMLANR